jgi:hypothetical protein
MRLTSIFPTRHIWTRLFRVKEPDFARGLMTRIISMKDAATESEYDQVIAEINRLLRKGEANLSPEENRLPDLLSTLVENWE